MLMCEMIQKKGEKVHYRALGGKKMHSSKVLRMMMAPEGDAMHSGN